MTNQRLARPIRSIGLLCAILCCSPAGAQDDPQPLQPADTSSPRATLQSFVENMNRMYELFKSESATSADQTAAFRMRAIRCLDLSKIDPAAINDLGEKRAVMLTEILDRIEMPAPEAIPDANEASQQELTRWRIPATEIMIEQVKDGPRQGEFLFSAGTVSRIPEFYDRVKRLPYRDGTVLPDAYAKLFTLAPPELDKATPLKPADTTSPQATLRTFLDNMNAVYRSFKAHGTKVEAAPERREFADRAIRTLNLDDVPPNIVNEVGKETSVLLMEVLDRIGLPVIEQVPDAAKAVETNLARWTIPETEITIGRVEEGPRKGEFLFTPETVNQAARFYQRVEHLPYKDGTVLRDAYHIYLQAPGPIIPIAWVLGMPSWMKQVEVGQPLWKWVALAVVLLLLAAGLVLTFRLGSRKREEDPRAPFFRRVPFPISGLLFAWLTERAIDQINASQNAVYFTSIVTTLLGSISLLWLIILVNDAIAESMVATPRINSKGIDAQLVRIVFRLLSVAAFVMIVLQTANDLGIPLTPVLAGLGVGGLAVALAAQNSLENLIGGINLFTDRPIRVGDFCRFGSRIGTVQEIGLRSTRVRSLDDTVISIPNSTFSKMELENYSKREKIWYHPRIQLARNVTPDQVRYVLVEVRKMLYAHPKVHSSPARIRFVEFGPYSLDLDVFAYVTVTDYGEFLGVAEDLNLRIMDILHEAGASLAVPVQRTIVERLAAPEEDRVQQTESQVRQWRENNELYLPSFPDGVVEKLRNTLDYPPQGAPNSKLDGREPRPG